VACSNSNSSVFRKTNLEHNDSVLASQIQFGCFAISHPRVDAFICFAAALLYIGTEVRIEYDSVAGDWNFPNRPVISPYVDFRYISFQLCKQEQVQIIYVGN
jgi:hypothetical protein